MPLVALHDAVDNGEPQAGPLSYFLGGEEGIEDMLPGFLVHAKARVGDREKDILPGHHILVASAIRFVKGDIAGMD